MNERTKIKLKYDLRWCAFLPVYLVTGTALAAFAPFYAVKVTAKDVSNGAPADAAIKKNVRDLMYIMFIDIPSQTFKYLNKWGSAPQLAKYDAMQKKR